MTVVVDVDVPAVSNETKIVAMKDAFSTIANGMAVRQEREGTGLPISRIETISDGRIDLDRCGYAGVAGSQAEKWLLKEGEILFSHINSPEQVGKCALVEAQHLPLVHGMNLLRLVPRPEVLDSRFALYYLRDGAFRSELRRFVNQAVNQASVSISNLKSLELRLPSLEDQRQIAATLDKADELRTKRRQALAHLDALTKSIFLTTFGDPASNPKGLPVATLGAIGRWQSGGTPLRSVNAFFTGDIPWYTSGELNSKFLGATNEMITDEAIVQSSAKIIPSGSLLLGMYDTAALKSGITTMPSSCNQAIAFGTLDPQIAVTDYVYQCIQTARDHYRLLQRGVRQKNLNLSMIRNLEIPLPPLQVQQEFRAKVAEVERIKGMHLRQLQELDSVFASLQHRAFRC